MERESAELLRAAIDGYKRLIMGKEQLSESDREEFGYLAHATSSNNDKELRDKPPQGWNLLQGHNFPRRFAGDIVVLNSYINAKHPKPYLAAIAREEIEGILPMVEMIVRSVLRP